MVTSEWLVKNQLNFVSREELIKKCMKSCKVTRSTVLKKLRLVDKTVSKPVENEKPVDEVNVSFKQETGIITTKSLNIKTLEDALRVSKVDLDIWEVDRYKINSWETTMGNKKTGTGRSETFTNYQVLAFLKRKIVQPLEIAINSILKNYKPAQYPKNVIRSIKHNRENKAPNLLEICLFDHHFGKLAWGKETGVDYDLKIARNLYHNAILDLINKTQNFEMEQICFPIGNDFFHINDPSALTPKAHNKLDTDARLAKVFECGIEACIKAIETCLILAPVEVLWVPGNHDPETSYYLCKVLQAHFRNTKDVKIDVDPHSRKYKRYGVSLLGYTHGDEEPHRDLPTIMADEMKQDWADNKFHEWHIGHLHKKKETRYTAGDMYGSVAVKIIPSLTGSDYWHYKKGYVKGARAAEAYIWNKVSGYVGHFSTNTIDLGME